MKKIDEIELLLDLGRWEEAKKAIKSALNERDAELEMEKSMHKWTVKIKDADITRLEGALRPFAEIGEQDKDVLEISPDTWGTLDDKRTLYLIANAIHYGSLYVKDFRNATKALAPDEGPPQRAREKEHALGTQYICPPCKDTGYIDGQTCLDCLPLPPADRPGFYIRQARARSKVILENEKINNPEPKPICRTCKGTKKVPVDEFTDVSKWVYSPCPDCTKGGGG